MLALGTIDPLPAITARPLTTRATVLALHAFALPLRPLLPLVPVLALLAVRSIAVLLTRAVRAGRRLSGIRRCWRGGGNLRWHACRHSTGLAGCRRLRLHTVRTARPMRTAL